MPTDELKQIFDFIRKNGTSNARQIGKAIPGGKSRANHYLYGYSGILFTKRGLTPPQWSVVSDDAYERMTSRLRPRSTPSPEQRSTPAPSRTRSRSIFPLPRTVSIRIAPQDLPEISVCQSCDLPIQPTGRCGCS
jgi:hypothetical protein